PRLASPHLEDRDAMRVSRLDVRVDGDVLRRRAGDRDLVVQLAFRAVAERGEADLDPLRGPVRAGARATDANPAADVPVEHGRRLDLEQRGRHAVGLAVALETGVRVRALAASARPGPGALLDTGALLGPGAPGRRGRDEREAEHSDEVGRTLEQRDPRVADGLASAPESGLALRLSVPRIEASRRVPSNEVTTCHAGRGRGGTTVRRAGRPAGASERA